MSQARTTVRRVVAANQRFYDAMTARDVELMCSLWERSRRAVCVRPDGPIARGWADIAEMWSRTMDGPARYQHVLSDVQVEVDHEVAWASFDEHVLSHEFSDSYATTNIFARHDGEWLMISHHSSLIDRNNETVELGHGL